MVWSDHGTYVRGGGGAIYTILAILSTPYGCLYCLYRAQTGYGVTVTQEKAPGKYRIKISQASPYTFW